MLMVYGYHAYNYRKGEDLFIYAPSKDLSMAENILMMLRSDRKYTPLEAKILDMALVLHMDHGGGNNSTFTTHVVTSSGTDTYSAISAALASLKGPKHGGANIKVTQMFADMKEKVSNWEDEAEVRQYLYDIVDKKAFDQKGLIYGMGHAIYSVSDPRAEVFKGFVEMLAKEKGCEKEYNLYAMVERLAPEIIAEKRRMFKGVNGTRVFAGVYMTGILPIKKYGTHSALNMFEEYTMVDPGPLVPYVGFTDEEVRLICDERDLRFEGMRAWYDGYRLSTVASGELVAAKRNLAQAEEALAARQHDLEEWEKTKEERRDRIYDAIIGREVSRDQIDMANEGVARIDEEGVLKADNVKRAEGEVKEKEAAADAARANLNFAIKNRMKIDEHKSAWLAEEAKEQEARAEGELEDFTVRKEEI
jgi:hypothetical protein